VLIQDGPTHWITTANLTLLSVLRQLTPDAIDWAGMRDVIPVLDAFEAAR
jgi:hypothetical protein